MRITGGIARGVTLGSPRAPGVRPTTDRVRTALFNILSGYGLDGTRVADLFAGTGSLGIEALSRGAAHASFIESDRRQVVVIRTNLRVAGFAERATVHLGRVEASIERLNSLNLALMDPPYTKPFPARLIAAIGAGDALSSGAIVVCGHASRVPANDRCGALVKWDDRKYGDSSLAFYSREHEVPA